MMRAARPHRNYPRGRRTRTSGDQGLAALIKAANRRWRRDGRRPAASLNLSGASRILGSAAPSADPGDQREARRRHAHPRPQTHPEYARKVEAMGFDCLWSAETQHDPFLPLAAAGHRHRRIKLGTSIASAFPRSPMVLAHISWDLAKASGGRFILGLGSQVKGHNERRFSVKWESPGADACARSSGAARHLGLLAERDQAQLQGPVLPVRRDDAVLQPRSDRAPRGPGLHRRREPVHVRGGRRAVRRPARPPVQQPQIPARGRAPRRRGGAPEVRPPPRGLHLRHLELRGGRRQREGARRRRPAW